ncbi:MAG: hypothetical protein HQK75_04110 [Candidatus Magnetomorum sp.]|nr:hypothetical protein [Candidatus Magnetomorum sp.]
MVKQAVSLLLFAMMLFSYDLYAGDVDNRLILEKLDSFSRRVDDKFDAIDRRFNAVDLRLNDLKNDINIVNK